MVIMPIQFQSPTLSRSSGIKLLISMNLNRWFHFSLLKNITLNAPQLSALSSLLSPLSSLLSTLSSLSRWRGAHMWERERGEMHGRCEKNGIEEAEEHTQEFHCALVFARTCIHACVQREGGGDRNKEGNKRGREKRARELKQQEEGDKEERARRICNGDFRRVQEREMNEGRDHFSPAPLLSLLWERGDCVQKFPSHTR